MGHKDQTDNNQRKATWEKQRLFEGGKLEKQTKRSYQGRSWRKKRRSGSHDTRTGCYEKKNPENLKRAPGDLWGVQRNVQTCQITMLCI